METQYLYKDKLVEIVVDRANGFVDVEIVDEYYPHDPMLPMKPGRVRITCVDRNALEPYKPFKLEANCARCNEPIFTDYPRYYIYDVVYCMPCGEDESERQGIRREA